MKTVDLQDVRYKLTECPIDVAIVELEKLQNEYKKEFSNLQIIMREERHERGCYELILQGDRPETEKEQLGREKEEEEQKKQRDEWDKKEFARLQAKYKGQ